MKIVLIGYGKMGQAIEKIAQHRGHQVCQKIDASDGTSLAALDPTTVDIAIEFTQPTVAYDNIHQCLSKNIPTISGTTGWLDRKPALDAYCEAQQGTFFYAANFSIGMNVFFKMNAFLARLMDQYPAYDVSIEEVHHTTKKDAPSGTTVVLAEGILKNLTRKKAWDLSPTPAQDHLGIVAHRVPDVCGIHTVAYKHELDTLEIKHTAHSRTAFALGAVLVAEWLPGRQGVLGMDDFLGLGG